MRKKITIKTRIEEWQRTHKIYYYIASTRDGCRTFLFEEYNIVVVDENNLVHVQPNLLQNTWLLVKIIKSQTFILPMAIGIIKISNRCDTTPPPTFKRVNLL